MRNQSLLLWVLLLVDGMSGNENEEVKVSGNIGKSVNLPTGFTELPDDTVHWRFDGKIIATLSKAAPTFETYDGPKGQFKGRLLLDKQTGSLTIKDISPEHAGNYELQIKSKTKEFKRFSVTVSVIGDEKKPVMKGDSFSLSTGVKLQGDIWIQWKFEDQVIPTDRLNGAVEERWSNIRLNNNRELCFIKFQSNQSGTYEVKANTSNLIVHKKFHITVEPPQSGAASGICGAGAGVGVGLVVWAVTVFLLQVV